MNQNWFNAMVEFHNTIRHIQYVWNVPRAIAKELQRMAAAGQSQADCQAVADASFNLRQQVGF